LAKERSLAPVDEPFVEQVFAGQSGWRLKLLHRKHPDYEGVAKQFVDNWQKPNPPTLERIFKVYSTLSTATLGSVDFWGGRWALLLTCDLFFYNFIAPHTQVASGLFENHQEYKRGLERKLAALTPAAASDHSANGTFWFESAGSIYLWPAFVLHPLSQGFALI
jgi:hypothetical protein